MKSFRKIWVFMTNSIAVYLLYASYSELASLNTLLEVGNRNRMLWFRFTLKASIPVLGILLELFGSRFAKWVNIGYFLLVGVVFSTIGILARGDYHALPLFVFGPAALLVAGVDWLLYRHARRLPTNP